MDKRYTIFRYIAYSLEILIIYVLQGTPFLIPEIFGGRPLLLIPVALTIAFFEKEVTAMSFGLACGVMLDIGMGGNLGFYTITMSLTGFIIGNIFRDYMVVNFMNTMAFCGAFCTGIICLYFLLFYIFAGRNEVGYYFVNHYLSRIVYTIAVSPVFYFLNKSFYKGLRDI